jgi:glutathione S-transferase
MLKLYYARPSIYARPVWLALLEKQLPFELISVDLSGEQFQPEFLTLNPFGHIPILLDGDLRIIESMAILDYLEARYPERSLLPNGAVATAKAKMAQMVALNELLPALFKLLVNSKKTNDRSIDLEYARLQAMNALSFLEDLLGNSPYFAGDRLTLAEIVAGTIVGKISDIAAPLTDYPSLQHWSERLLARPTWQQLELSPEEWTDHQRRMRVIPKIWQHRRRQRMKAIEGQ